MNFLSTWSVIKAAGFTSYLLLLISVILGALTYGKPPSSKVFNVMFTTHQLTGLIGFLFGLLHGLVLSVDSYIHFSFAAIFIPFASPYEPIASGLGTIALYLSFIVLVSSDLMKKLGRKAWGGIHTLAFPLYMLSLLHGLWAGSDSSALWSRLFYMGTLLLFLAIILIRFLLLKRKQTGGMSDINDERPVAIL